MNTPSVTAKRWDRDSPSVIAKDGWRFHHIGIPTTVARPGPSPGVMVAMIIDDGAAIELLEFRSIADE